LFIEASFLLMLRLHRQRGRVIAAAQTENQPENGDHEQRAADDEGIFTVRRP
jgi:hypothetical protein